MSKKKGRAVVTRNEIIEDVVKRLESDGRWNARDAADRLQVLDKIVEQAIERFEQEVDRLEGEASRLVEKQTSLDGAVTLQLPLEGMPEAHKAIVTFAQDGSKEITSLAYATPNQHKAYTKLRLERKRREFNLARRRDEDSDKIIAELGIKNADTPFGEQFAADVFPQVGQGRVMGEISDGS
jgi:hypothetical protein